MVMGTEVPSRFLNLDVNKNINMSQKYENKCYKYIIINIYIK